MKKKYAKTRFMMAVLIACSLQAEAQWVSPASSTITYTTDKIGIGTSAPAAPLHVASGSQRILLGGGTNTSGYDFAISANDDGVNFANNSAVRAYNFKTATQRIHLLTGSNTSGYDFNIGVNDDGVNFSNNSGVRGYNFKTLAGTLLSIAPAGYVVVGTVSSFPAGYKLFVDQGILTEKVKVAVSGSTQWADHVFNKEYQLMPLSEVEQFVKTNNHLPNVPSADEMVREGNDLGKTDAKLLEKIEELTLYIIEMKKEIQQLKAENASGKTNTANNH